MQHGKPCLLSLHIGIDRLEGIGCSLVYLSQHILYERMIGIEHQLVSVGHLSVEAHTGLEAAHVLHTTHVLVLCDQHRHLVSA